MGWNNRSYYFAMALVVLIAFVEVFPYLWMALTSVKTLSEVTRFPPTFLPHQWQFQNYVEAWQSGPFLRYFFNTAYVAIAIVVLQILFACTAAYAFSKLHFPGRDLLFYVVVACLIVPPQVRFVPLYILLSKMGLINTYSALILPYATSALGTFLIRQSFLTIPNDVIEAAKIDGANVFQIIFRILAPIAKPAIIAFGLFSVVYHWNDYFWPLVMTTTDDVRTLPLGVAMLREQGTGARWHVIMAGNMYVVVPMLIAFAFAQRHIIRAFTFSSLK